jgi:hypothetical protein
VQAADGDAGGGIPVTARAAGALTPRTGADDATILLHTPFREQLRRLADKHEWLEGENRRLQSLLSAGGVTPVGGGGNTGTASIHEVRVAEAGMRPGPSVEPPAHMIGGSTDDVFPGPKQEEVHLWKLNHAMTKASKDNDDTNDEGTKLLTNWRQRQFFYSPQKGFWALGCRPRLSFREERWHTECCLRALWSRGQGMH